LSLLVIVRAFFAGEVTFYEMGRYLSHVLPAIFLLGLFGKQTLEEWAGRWQPNWGRAARIGYLTAWFTLPPPGFNELYLRPDFRPEASLSQVLLDLNTQREVRYLVGLTENNPQCVFVARVVDEHFGDFMEAPRYAYVVFGAPISLPITVPENQTRLD